MCPCRLVVQCFVTEYWRLITYPCYLTRNDCVRKFRFLFLFFIFVANAVSSVHGLVLIECGSLPHGVPIDVVLDPVGLFSLVHPHRWDDPASNRSRQTPFPLSVGRQIQGQCHHLPQTADGGMEHRMAPRTRSKLSARRVSRPSAGTCPNWPPVVAPGPAQKQTWRCPRQRRDAIKSVNHHGLRRPSCSSWEIAVIAGRTHSSGSPGPIRGDK